ncbi:MAG: 1-deoxy-D-xylulose-5-phosphate synthase [Proteobacteria bacterium]|nr:1-deoxy-D-xylulose-5-phosphate synthase [Pseudomonadota bacterium]
MKSESNLNSLLSNIDDPADLRSLDTQQLIQLARELRHFLIESTAITGGHLAPGLGTVELTIALHYVFNTPYDRLVWDIGHQAYPHKVLTGRRDQLRTIRQLGGLSGFLKRSESEYDTFGAGHSSTSISAALGMAVAAQQKDEQREVIAVIGDGALTGGMAYEALNNAGDLDANLLVILNDNDMSISPNVGAMSNYLSRILSGRAYSSVREGSKTVLSTLPPPVKTLARRWEEHMKGMVMPGTLFEEMGFNYIGPVDGHDLPLMISVLKNMAKLKGPRFLHIVTQKGRGYEPAEGNPCTFHGISPFDPDTGKITKSGGKRSYTNVFSDWLTDMAAQDDRLVAITPAMREGSGLVKFSEQYPQRYFDVGIAEQHALTFAAGLACEKIKPVVAIYSTFLQRAYDQLIHDIAIQKLDVTLVIDRAGIVGADGATHAGLFDIAFMRCIPNMLILCPKDEAECRDMLFTAYRYPGPAAVRYPRGGGSGIKERVQMQALEIGRAERLRKSRAGKGKRIAILAWGDFVANCEPVAEALDCTLVNMRFAKPLDENLLHELAKSHDYFATVEDHAVRGGAGSAVDEFMQQYQYALPVLNIGTPDQFIDHGTQPEIYAQLGLDTEGIEHSIREFCLEK